MNTVPQNPIEGKLCLHLTHAVTDTPGAADASFAILTIHRNVVIRKIILHSFIALLLTLCGGCKDSGTEIRNCGLVNTTWRLESFETIGVGTDRIQDGRVYSVTFLPDTNLRARADCNDCIATYHTFGGGINAHISLTALSCTKVYCGSESLDWRFTDGLRNVMSYNIEGINLRLYYNDNKQVLNFRAQ
jgi:hypothetical protein